MTTSNSGALDRRVPLAFLPTPLHDVPRLREAIGPDTPPIYLKRDDQTGLATGGNKARKLEYLMAEAVEAGADVVVTGGAMQTNHGRQTAAAAAKQGLDCILVLAPGAMKDEDYTESGNVLLDKLVGAELRPYDGPLDEMGDRIEAVMEELRGQGRTPYAIPLGGSTGVGALGYARCVVELVESGVEFDHIVTTTGSTGTHAGLLAGVKLTGIDARVQGYSVGAPAEIAIEKVHAIAADTCALLGVDAPDISEVHVDDSFLGPGYGVPTDAMREAVSLLAETEGILLDPVYTGKAFAGFVDTLRNGSTFDGARGVVFLHTGGQVGLFAYRDTLTAE